MPTLLPKLLQRRLINPHRLVEIALAAHVHRRAVEICGVALARIIPEESNTGRTENVTRLAVAPAISIPVGLGHADSAHNHVGESLYAH